MMMMMIMMMMKMMMKMMMLLSMTSCNEKHPPRVMNAKARILVDILEPRN